MLTAKFQAADQKDAKDSAPQPSHAANANVFFKDAKGYRDNSTPQAIRNGLALARLGLVSGLRVLDVGCGTGLTTRVIAEKVAPAPVVGLDISKVMLASAMKDYGAIPNLTFMEADAANFNLSQTFDVITAFFSLQWVGAASQADSKLSDAEFHIDRMKNACKCIYAHLAESGQFCAMLPGYDFPHVAIKDVAFSQKWLPYFEKYYEKQKFYNAEFYSDLLDKVGFKRSEIWSEELSTQHPMTDAEFLAYTRQWCLCYKFSEDPVLAEAFIKDVTARLAKQPHDHNGVFIMRQETLFLSAKKPALELNARPQPGFKAL